MHNINNNTKAACILSFTFSCYYYCLCIDINFIDTTRCHNVVNSSSFTKKSASSGYPYYDTITPRHDDQFDMIQNPIYELASQCNKYNQYVQASNNKHVQGST